MSNKKKAFPHIEIKSSEPPGTHKKIYHQGLDLRDYFAAKAMQSLVANFANDTHGWGMSYQSISDEAYRQADAMMEARKNKD